MFQPGGYSGTLKCVIIDSGVYSCRHNFVQEIRKDYRRIDRKYLWKDVWDWEKASFAWEEREKMQEWTVERAKRAEEIKSMKAQWQKTLSIPTL